MSSDPDANKDNFFYPRSRYQGEFSPQALTFNANLQEFAQRVSLVCSLETGGKITSEEAYKQIRDLWKMLKRSKKKLLDQAPPEDIELPPDDGI